MATVEVVRLGRAWLVLSDGAVVAGYRCHKEAQKVASELVMRRWYAKLNPKN